MIESTIPTEMLNRKSVERKMLRPHAQDPSKGIIDRYGRQIDYLRVSLTDVCNLRCVYCMPEDMQFRQGPELMQHDEFRDTILSFAGMGFKKIRYTGGEPTLFQTLPQLVAEVHQAAPDALQALTTNGINLSHLARPLKDAGLQRVNISVDTLNPERYRQITRWGNVKDVLAGISAAEAAGLEIKLNCVVVRGVNDGDDVVEIAELTRDKPWQVRFIELMPFGGGIDGYQRSHIVSEQELRDHISHSLGVLTLQNEGKLDGEARMFKLANAKGSLGFISSVTAPFCAGCNRARLTADGKLRLCLLRPDEVDLLKPLRDRASEDTIRTRIRNAIYNKPWGHDLAHDDFATNRAMSEIGG